MTSTPCVRPLKLSNCPYGQSNNASGARACHISGARSGATSEDRSAIAHNAVRTGRGSQIVSMRMSAPAATPADTPGLSQDSHAADVEGALCRLQQRPGQIARQLQRRIEGRREQRYAGVDLGDEPDPEQREAKIADPAFEKHTISPLRNALAQPRCAIECQRRDRTDGRTQAVGD